VKAPLINISVEHSQRPYAAGDQLTGEFQINSIDAGDVRALELSILWYTEGKGDEDIGVHHFERWTDEDTASQSLTEPRKLRLPLPNSPLSYEGVLVKIRWCVRVRVFLKNGREYYADAPFRLGTVTHGRPLESGPDQATDGNNLAMAGAAEDAQ
jgi:hypothetical protein